MSARYSNNIDNLMEILPIFVDRMPIFLIDKLESQTAEILAKYSQHCSNILNPDFNQLRIRVTILINMRYYLNKL